MNAITSLSPVASAMMENPLGAFLAKASIEITGRQVDKVPLLVDLLPRGASVFVALIDAADLAGQIAAVACAAQSRLQSHSTYPRALCARCK